MYIQWAIKKKVVISATHQLKSFISSTPGHAWFNMDAPFIKIMPLLIDNEMNNFVSAAPHSIVAKHPTFLGFRSSQSWLSFVLFFLVTFWVGGSFISTIIMMNTARLICAAWSGGMMIGSEDSVFRGEIVLSSSRIYSTLYWHRMMIHTRSCKV